MNNVVFSVIIVSYNNLQVLIDCIESVNKYNDINNKLEIIVVDNSSNENIYKYVKTNFTQVQIIKNDNKGFGEGNNVGAKSANGKYLLLLNPDTILVEPLFRFAIKSFENDKNLGLFGVKLVDLNLKRNMSYYIMDNTGFYASQINKILNVTDIFIDGKMLISGANMFVRKDTFIDCGMFDEKIFMYCEEQDLIKRIRLLGKKTAYFKSKRIIHLEGKTSHSKETTIIRRLESKKYYCNKYNLNFIKKVKSELRYNYFKLFIYKFINNNRLDICSNNISILKDYINRKSDD